MIPGLRPKRHKRPKGAGSVVSVVYVVPHAAENHNSAGRPPVLCITRRAIPHVKSMSKARSTSLALTLWLKWSRIPISDLCDEYGIPPNQIYKWQAIVFENAPTVFQQAGTRAKGEAAAGEEKLARLEAKVQQKNEVIAELMQEHVELKKAVGEP